MGPTGVQAGWAVNSRSRSISAVVLTIRPVVRRRIGGAITEVTTATSTTML